VKAKVKAKQTKPKRPRGNQPHQPTAQTLAQLEALEAHYATEAAWRKAESERALQRWSGVRQVPRPWLARAALAAAAMVGAT
jgi:hypothetical protein